MLRMGVMVFVKEYAVAIGNVGRKVDGKVVKSVRLCGRLG